MNIMQFMLPWFDPSERLNYSLMTLHSEKDFDRRQCFRIIRKWYKEHIGCTIDKQTLVSLWKRRHITTEMKLEQMNNALSVMAQEDYFEEIEEEGHPLVQEGAAE